MRRVRTLPPAWAAASAPRSAPGPARAPFLPSRRTALAALGLSTLLPGCLDSGPADDPQDVPAPITSLPTNIRLALTSFQTVSFGGYMNAESFQQDGILTFNGFQYAAYWNTGPRVVLARRPSGDNPWLKIEMAPAYTSTSTDAHNTISLGVSPRDGRLHISFDQHDSDLRYVQSVPELLTRPDTVPWATESFGPIGSELGGRAVQQLTYPRFVTTPDGLMLLSYRRGGTGQGDEVLWQYDGTTGTWTELGVYIAGIEDGVNAYLHGLEYSGRRLHAAWCWRTTADPSTNFDLAYAWSEDDGRTWHNNEGEVVGRTGTAPIRRNSAVQARAIGQNRGLINQEHMTVDGAGRVHVLLSHLPDDQPDDADFARARTRSEFFHYWRDANGIWRRVPMNIAVQGTWRGKLAVARSGNLYAVLPNVRIASASAAVQWANWTVIDSSQDGRYFSDPLIDRQQLRSSDRLTVFAPTVNQGGVVPIDSLGYTLY